MEIKDFIEKFKRCVDDEDRDTLVKSIIKTNYVPIEVKKITALQIMQSCYHDKDGNVKCDSVSLYVAYTMSLLRLYTSLELDGKEAVDNYNALQQYRIIDYIVNCLGSDQTEFRTVFNMCRDDFERQHYSVRGVAEWGLDSVMKIAEVLMGVMSQMNEAGEENSSNS